ncbi:MAG: hypothetical protein ABJQ21_06155 [Roseibium sp.]
MDHQVDAFDRVGCDNDLLDHALNEGIELVAVFRINLGHVYCCHRLKGSPEHLCNFRF